MNISQRRAYMANCYKLAHWCTKELHTNEEYQCHTSYSGWCWPEQEGEQDIKSGEGSSGAPEKEKLYHEIIEARERYYEYSAAYWEKLAARIQESIDKKDNGEQFDP